MSEHQFSLNLRQHTPLIHFQWRESNATLRATEIKPKLDRFILNKLGRLEGEEYVAIAKEQWKLEHKEEDEFCFNNLSVGVKGTYLAKGLGWLIGKGEHPALNYKIKVCAKDDINTKKKNSSTGTDELKSYPLYFGNLKKKESEQKKFKWTDQLINLTLFSLNSDLLRLLNGGKVCCFSVSGKDLFFSIPDLMDEFFLHTNFGSRQSKGFGSFTVDREVPVTMENHPFQHNPWFSIKPKNSKEYSSEWHEVFSNIELFYKFLRGGINQNGLYLKPFIFQYMKEYMGYNWEKKNIKKEYFSKPFGVMKGDHIGETESLSGQIEKHKTKSDSPLFYENENFRLIRDLFGLSTSAEWRHYYATIEKEDSITGEDGKKDITRFPSPLLFKVIKEKVNSNEDIYYVGILFRSDVIESFQQHLCGHKFKISGRLKEIYEPENGTKLRKKLKKRELPSFSISFPDKFSNQGTTMSFEEFWVDFFEKLVEKKDTILEIPAMKSTELSEILNSYSYKKQGHE